MQKKHEWSKANIPSDSDGIEPETDWGAIPKCILKHASEH
jgi:hypothetical protein